MMEVKLKQIKQLHQKESEAHFADDESPRRTRQQQTREKREAHFEKARNIMDQVNLINRDRLEK